jgi:hypothetical protein
VKTIVFLLVLANLLFYAFGAGYFGRPDNPDAGRIELQVLPERMRIISRGEAPAAPAKPAPVAEVVKPEEPAAATEKAEADKPVSPETEAKADKAAVCLNWRQLSAAEADRLSALLTRRFGDYRQTRKVATSEGNGWWVFIPAQPSKADAERKSAELRELGVAEFFIVPDEPNRFAISLGVFSSEKGGQDRLAELKAKGVRSALVAPRPGKDALISLQARGPAGMRAEILAAVGQALPKAEAFACR